MAIHHNDWTLHVMYETIDELVAEYAVEKDLARLSALELALDARHYYF